MSQLTPPELDGWQQIIDQAAIDNDVARSQAAAKASHKQVLAIANLTEGIFNSQKHISDRLDKLNKQLDNASRQSGELAKRTYILTWVLASAATIQAITAVVLIFKAK